MMTKQYTFNAFDFSRPEVADQVCGQFNIAPDATFTVTVSAPTAYELRTGAETAVWAAVEEHFGHTNVHLE